MRTTTSGNVPALISALKQANKVCVGSCTTGSGEIKAISRQLACFIGRLDGHTTEEDHHEYLTSKGMKGVHCRKLVPKDGRIFKISAFKVLHRVVL